MQILLITNPVSGRGRAQRRLGAAVRVFRDAGWRVGSVVTSGPGDACRAAAGFDGDMIVCFGGDGTFNEILNGAHLDRCILAVMPAGTGNVLARELRMPLEPADAARAIVSGRILRFDAGRANGRLFAFACGAGLDAHIVRLLHGARSGNITQLHYLPYLLRNAVSPPDWCIRVDIDGRRLVEGVNVVCIGNTRSYGGPVELTPRADPGDGRLDVAAARLGSVLDIPGVALAALTRGMSGCSQTCYCAGYCIKLSARHREAPYHADGDFAGTLPLTVTVEKGRMRLVSASGRHARSRILPV